MKNEYDIFVKTLQIGEMTLDISYTDYQDAYSFSKQQYTSITHHFIDFFENHSDKKRGEYEYNVIRYIFVKAIENRISSDLYADTSRGNVCDVFHSPFDIGMVNYPTNLPRHLENIVNSNQAEAHKLANAVVAELNRDWNYGFSEALLNAVMFLGHTVGYRIGQENVTYKNYKCSEMLTRNELNLIAGTNLCNWLRENDFEIRVTNCTRDTYQNIVAQKDDLLLFILLSVEVAPDEPSFIPLDLDNLYKAAHDAGAKPYYASISLGSINDTHFSDGVLLFGDEVRYRVNAFGELELE